MVRVKIQGKVWRCMIHIKIYLPDGRVIPAQIHKRQYKKLVVQVLGLHWWQRLKLLFIGNKR